MSISSQSSSSSLHKIVHLDQISTIHVQSCTKLPSKTSSETFYCDQALSVEVIRVHIFTFLPLVAAVNACHFNRAWRRLENKEHLWRAKFSQDVRDTFDPLVEQKLVTWSKVSLYARLSFFVASIVEDRLSWDDFILLKNPEFNNRQIPYACMPHPFVLYGNCHFAICNRTNIEVQEEGNPEPFFLKGEAGKMLVRLAVEGKNVFALTEHGEIFHWDDKIRKENISTAYSTGGEDFKRERMRFSGSEICDGFYIKNGIIIMTYAKKAPTDSVKLLEIIPLKDPEKHQLIMDFPLTHNLVFIEVLKDHQIIMMGNNSTFKRSIWKMTLPKSKTDTWSMTSPLNWTILSQNSLEAMTGYYSIKGIGLDRHPSSKAMRTCIVIQNLVFSFAFSRGGLCIDVMRMNAENTRYVYSYSYEDPVPLDFATPQWRTDMLTKLFLIAQKELRPVPQVTVTPMVASTLDSVVVVTPDPELQFEPQPKPTSCCVIA